MKKLMICLLAAACFLTPVRAESYPITKDFTVEAQWTLDHFNAPSSVYNEQLALCCLAICAASHQSGNEVNGILEMMNFEKVVRLNYEQRIINKPSVTLACQRSGDKVYYLVQIRGTKTVEDAVTDLMGGIFNGFILAGENTYKMFEDYRASCYPDVSPDNTYVLICGHSLGGATAGQLTRQFRMKSVIPQEHIYVYTLASPLYDIEQDDPALYDNVFNLIVSEDMVPKVPWQYHRVGTDICYTDERASFSFFDYATTVFYAEDLTDKVPAVAKHHSLETYYDVITQDRYDTDSGLKKFFRSLLSTMLELAERCLR